MQYVSAVSKNNKMISVYFQGKSFNIMVMQVYAPTRNAEEAEVEWFYEELQDLLELTPKKDVLFILGDWNAKVGSQETPGVTGKFGLGVQGLLIDTKKAQLVPLVSAILWELSDAFILMYMVKL